MRTKRHFTAVLTATVYLLTFGALSAGVATGQAARLRIYVTDSSSWEVGGAGALDSGTGGGGFSGGARPQTAEIIKTFDKRCPAVTVTNRRENADYIVLLDHEGGKEFFGRDNKIVIFDKQGDLIHSGSTRSLGNAVKDACSAIERNSAGRR